MSAYNIHGNTIEIIYNNKLKMKINDKLLELIVIMNEVSTIKKISAF